jgi:dihydrofolate reductase
MPKLRVHNLAMSIDGFAAGPDQCLETPLGVRGEELHEWIFTTKTWHEMIGEPGGDTGVDDAFMARGFEGIGATIMGRNMFGPIRGEWPDDTWRGWWGETPPYHHPVFVLTHYARDPLEMDGGTTFHFTDEPIAKVLERAFEAAQGADVRLGGGAATIQQYLRAGLVDEMHVPIVPILLGSGERLFATADDVAGYECTEFVTSPRVAHAVLTKRAS